MRPIKFDLPLNGTRIATLEQLEDNLTPEILEPFRSGKLAKWLRARSLDEQAGTVEALLAANVQDEVQLFIKLCEVFEREVDEDDAREMIDDYASKNAAAEEIAEAQKIELVEKDDKKQAGESSLNNATAKLRETLALIKEVKDISEEQIKLLEEGNEEQRTELASRPDLSEKLQNKLLQDKAESVLVALSSNPSLLEEIQNKLAITGAPAVREALAANPSLNEKQQNYLATTGSQDVKCRLAKNPSLSVTVQSLLVSDGAWNIRRDLAGNSSLDISCQSKLIGDSDVDVKIALAGNSALTNDFQQRMANSGEDRVIVGLAKNPSLSDALMEKLAVSSTGEIKESLASNPSLSEPLQARFIANDSSKVKELLANNPSLAVAQQAELANVGDVDARLALLENLSLNESIKTRVIASFDQYDLSRMERDLNYERERADKLFLESLDITKKVISSWTGLFSSPEKTERLQRESDRISERLDETQRKGDVLYKKVCKIKDILN